MGQTERQLPELLDRLRWVIPLLISAVGVGYTIVEHLIITPHPITSFHVVREALITGTVGPGFTWALLTWATAIARSRQAAEEMLERRNRELVALNAIAETASRSLDVNEILQAAVHRMVDVLDLEAAEIRTLEGSALVLQSHYGVSPQFVADEEVIALGECVCGHCAAAGSPLIVGDLTLSNGGIARPCIREGFRSVLAIPMRAKEQVVGVIHLASRDVDSFTTHDQQLLGAIGHQIAVAVENARLYAETEQQALQLETASQVGRQMTQILDIDVLLKQVTQLIRERFGFHQVHIFLVEEAHSELALREASGSTAVVQDSPNLGLIRRVVRTGELVVSDDMCQELKAQHVADLPAGTRSRVAVPLQIGDRTVGVLAVESDECATFDAADVKTMQILADQIAIAMENARLFQETRQRFQAMTALHETSLDIVSQLDSQDVLQSILRRAADLLKAEGGSLGIYETDTGLIRKIAIHNLPAKYRGAAIPVGEGVAGKVVETGEPLIVNDYLSWSGRSPTFADTPLDALVGVPLRWKGQVIGSLDVLDRSDRRPFSQEDIWILHSFADLASIAIKNAELYSEVKALSQDLEQRVTRRTAQLAAAQSELARKAEQLQALLNQIIDLQEGERARIARDMHDSITQVVLGALYATQASREALQMDATNLPIAQNHMTMVQRFLQQLEVEIRRTIHDLRPPILDDKGIVPALDQYLGRYEELTRIRCSVCVTGSPLRLPDDTEVGIYRIVQEALQNVASHSGADAARVGIHFDRDAVRVKVEDDGCGFDADTIPTLGEGHFGLIGMRERAANIGATVHIDSVPGQGTSLTLDVPIRH